MRANIDTTALQKTPRNTVVEALNLPFIIRTVRTEEHLTKAVRVRADTYRKHHPELAIQLTEPEADDRAPFSLVLLAESKKDGTAVGTMRIETNAFDTIKIEELLPKFSHFSNRPIAFVTRLGVRNCQDSHLIKIALFKALHRYCLACQIEWMVVAAKPPMDRQYLKLGFSDVYETDTLIPIPWSGNIRTRILALNTIDAEQNWKRSNNPLYDFMINNYGPDIQIFSSVSGIWTRSRIKQADLPSTEILNSVFDDAAA